MSEGYSIITCQNVSETAVRDFIGECGGFDTDKDYQVGRLSIGDEHIWIYYSSNPNEEYEAETIRLIERSLPTKPKAKIIIEIGDGNNTEKLAAIFACKFLTKWESVVYESVSDKLLTRNEICGLSEFGVGIVQNPSGAMEITES